MESRLALPVDGLNPACAVGMHDGRNSRSYVGADGISQEHEVSRSPRPYPIRGELKPSCRLFLQDRSGKRPERLPMLDATVEPFTHSCMPRICQERAVSQCPRAQTPCVPETRRRCDRRPSNDAARNSGSATRSQASPQRARAASIASSSNSPPKKGVKEVADDASRRKNQARRSDARSPVPRRWPFRHRGEQRTRGSPRKARRAPAGCSQHS